ncbi:putative methyltransferase EEF1AKMT1/ZCCHC4 [Helianthus anomalus]
MEDETNHNAVAGAGANDDGTPTLSAHALEALKEFLSEQNRSVAADNDGATAAEEKEVALVTEDWRLSQFWYDRETAETVAREVHALYTSMEDPPSVACIACPTLYVYLKVYSHVQTHCLLKCLVY